MVAQQTIEQLQTKLKEQTENMNQTNSGGIQKGKVAVQTQKKVTVATSYQHNFEIVFQTH